MLEATVSVPALPGVPDTSERLDDPSLLVTTEAVTPRFAVDGAGQPGKRVDPAAGIKSVGRRRNWRGADYDVFCCAITHLDGDRAGERVAGIA